MASSLPFTPPFIERLIQKWTDKRLPLKYQNITIDRRRLYILPTRHGITFVIILLLILFGSINYENSLGLMLTFLLGSLGFLGMIHTHQNLNKLNIKIGHVEPVFSGQNILFPIYISRTEASVHPNLKLLSETGQISTTHLIDETNTQCKLAITTSRRGYISPGRIKIFTEYPLGLFHAWSWLKFDSRCLVYPAPDSQHHPLHFIEENLTGNTNKNSLGTDDFSGIREYSIGDLPNHMAWKAIAKTQVLQTKLYSSESSQKAWVNWELTNGINNIEHRLSILCRMVLDANEKNILYGMSLPGITIDPSFGEQHKHRCLKYLALFGRAK